MRGFTDPHELEPIWPYDVSRPNLLGAVCTCRKATFEAHSQNKLAKKFAKHLKKALPPEQPDDLPDDEPAYPDPVRAARRVLEYVSVFGDGLYDVASGKPLYGRDLEVLAKVALAYLGASFYENAHPDAPAETMPAGVPAVVTVNAPILAGAE